MKIDFLEKKKREEKSSVYVPEKPSEMKIENWSTLAPRTVEKKAENRVKNR